jgi:hypothetical protein
MRRRLWWQIIHIDVRAAEVSGAGIANIVLGDIKRPLNVNDEDLYPEMTAPPPEREGSTEMCFVMLRCSIGRYFRYLFRPVASGDPGSDQTYQYAYPEKQMDQMMADFEAYLHETFLTNADPLVPIQFFTSMVARAILCSWKVMNALRKHTDNAQQPSVADRNMMFEESLKSIEYDNLGHTTKATQRFMWHVNTHFQWHSFITLLGELRFRPSGELSDKAWKQVGEVYAHHPEILKVKSPLHTAVSSLTLSAWQVKEADHMNSYRVPVNIPSYIATIRQQMTARSEAKDKSTPISLQSMGSVGSQDFEIIQPVSTNSQSVETSSDNLLSLGGGSTLDFANMDQVVVPPSNPINIDPSPMDWSLWDNLLTNYEIPMEGGDYMMPNDNNFGGFRQ